MADLTEIIRGAFGCNDFRKSIYTLKVQGGSDSNKTGFACAVQIRDQNDEERYFLMTSCDILSKDDFSRGKTVVADRYCSNWPKHKEIHQIVLENPASEVLQTENRFCFVPLDKKPQHYLRHDTTPAEDERLKDNPDLVLYSFLGKTFIKRQFTFALQHGRYILNHTELSSKDMKDLVGSPLLIKNESSDLVVGVVGRQHNDDEEIGPVLFGESEIEFPVKRPKINISESQILRKLNKSNFDGHIDSLVSRYHQGTRVDILNNIQSLVESKHRFSDTQIMVVLAHAGVGKSVLAATACKTMDQQGKLAACHFMQQSNSLRNSPRMMFESLASHLCETVVGFQEQLEQRLLRNKEQELNQMNCRELFTVFLEEPLNSCNPPQNGNLLVVIDALDECDPNQRRELTTALFNLNYALPTWIKFLITSRPTKEDLPSPPGMCIININPADPENVRDVRSYLRNGLQHIYPNAEPEELTSCVNQLADGADSLFLFAYFVVDIAKTKQMELSRVPKIFPKGLSSVYEEYFTRLQRELNVEEEKYFDFLEAIAAAQDPLPETLVLQILGFDERSRKARKAAQKALNHVSILLHVQDRHVTVFHKSVVDWLVGTEHENSRLCEHELEEEALLKIKRTEKFQDHSFSVRVEDGHRLLAQCCINLRNGVKASQFFPPRVNDSERYALKYGFTHMMRAGDFEEQLQESLQDPELLTACLLTMSLETFVNEIYRIVPKTFLEENTSVWPLTRWSFIKTPSNHLICDLSALANSAFVQMHCTLPHPIQSAINCPMSSVVRKETRILARKPKYKDCIFLEWEPKTWDLPVMINSDISMSVSPSGKTSVIWGTNRPGEPVEITVAVFKAVDKIADVCSSFDVRIPPRDVCISPDDIHAMFVTAVGYLEQWNVQTLRLERKFETTEKQYATSCCFSTCGTKVVSGYKDGNIRVWDFDKATIETILDGHAGEVVRCVVSANGRLLAGAKNHYNDAGTLVLWQSLSNPSSVILSQWWVTEYNCLAFSPSGDRIIAVCSKPLEDETLTVEGANNEENEQKQKQETIATPAQLPAEAEEKKKEEVVVGTKEERVTAVEKEEHLLSLHSERSLSLNEQLELDSIDLWGDLTFLRNFDATKADPMGDTCLFFESVHGVVAINESHVLLSAKSQANDYYIEILDTEQDEIVCQAAIAQDVYCLIKHGNSSEITALCTWQSSSRIFQNTCDSLILDLSILNLEY